ncbi:sensor histidine kinase [Stackebrandtia nassauensis]|uniref:histidine kinase n=1 Tax=Stackebrandtia nassauensis (strain DSM 44728 / CIP 108903 / NRRL B-16338 / NBRC 102104 / LLR-40K-21) TaxID=446470 RepID=D3PUE3_STANL|nr:sensor histidine kinase [Stackebrandtia nassauensis]ADD42956.1 histidine kinase [Stackebrandtia nassauensis DSM 44728]
MRPRLPHIPDRAKDWAIAIGVTVTVLVTALSQWESATVPHLAGVALLTASGLALVARRQTPILVLAVTGLCAVGYQATGFDVPAVAYVFAVYAAVRARHRLVTVLMSLAVLAALPLSIYLSGQHDTAEVFAQARGALEIAWLVAAAAAGEALRQAEQRADEAERTREETARRRANEERLHIARELHDSLTHQISVVKVQSEVAVHVARKRGEQVPDAVLAIQKAGREATRELRATLAALRDDDTTPPRGLDDVGDLVEQARAIGLAASLTIDGKPPPMPATVDRTIYRIVQESLTNIARHADTDTATVHIDCRPDTLRIRVDDDGKAAPDTATVPGVGLLGMRERVTALGGRLRAEPRGGGGFTVQAELPLEQTP